VRFVAVRLVATSVAVVGSVNLLTSVRPHATLARLAAPLDGGTPGRAPAFILGVLLIAIARGLLARRLAAWWGGVVVLAVMTLAAVVHRAPAVLLAGCSLLVLIAFRKDFATRPDPARLRLAAQIGAVATGTAVFASVWVLVAGRHDPREVGHRLAFYLAGGSPDTWRAAVVTGVVAACVVAAVVVAFLPAAPPAPGAALDRAEVCALAATGAPDSLAPFATRADKAYVFSSDRRAAIGYRVLFGTALAGGDPVGAADGAAAAIEEFLALCTRRGWRPAVLGASDEMTAIWRRSGMRRLHIGDEAVLPVESFCLASRRMRNVRQAVSRSRNAGVRVTIGPMSEDLAVRLAPVLDQWLGGRRERGFAMNLDAILTPRPDCLVAVAYTAGGEAVAFARFAVGANGTVYTLDVAPRGILAPNGVAERMIVEVVAHAREHGARELSLNFAAFRWVFDSPTLPGRTFAAFLHGFDRWIEIVSLNRFCEKFHPQWRARHLLTPSWAQLGWVAAAAVRAELTVPRQRRPDRTLGGADVPDQGAVAANSAAQDAKAGDELGLAGRRQPQA
jgi:lysylphosphatidylglycerol synthetase-like protein (DUF2156 family)